MDRKCTTIVCLVAMVVVLGDLGSYGVILSMICLAVPIYYDIDRVLPYNSRNREMQSFWDRKKYLYVGEMSFRMAFNLAFGVYTVGLLGSTLAKIRRSNPKFQDTLIGFCIALMVVSGCLMLFFWSGASNVAKYFLGFLGIAVFCIPMFVYPRRVKSNTMEKNFFTLYSKILVITFCFSQTVILQ